MIYSYLQAFYSFSGFQCGGFIVAPKIVLTAAHCQVRCVRKVVFTKASMHHVRVLVKRIILPTPHDCHLVHVFTLILPNSSIIICPFWTTFSILVRGCVSPGNRLNPNTSCESMVRMGVAF